MSASKPATPPRYVYLCGGCDHYHPLGWKGDCRVNEQRFTSDVLDAGAIEMLEDAPIPPAGIRPRSGVEMGCGEWSCESCYEAIQ